MKMGKYRIFNKFAPVLFLLLMIVQVIAFSQNTAAASYEAIMNSGDHYTLYVGDTLYLTNPAPTANMAFKAYGWSSGSGIVEFSSYNSKTVGVKAVKPGSTYVYSELTGSIPYQKANPIYNSATGKWETYYTTYYESYTYPYKVYIDIVDNVAPTVTAQPKSACAADGKTVSTSVKATDTSKLQYQWYVKNPGGKAFAKSAVTSAKYSCKMSAKVSGRQVYCVITDEYGNSTKTKTVTLSLLSITKQPANAYVKKGATASTSVKVAGKGLTYTWYYKNPGSSKFEKSSIKTAVYSYKMTAGKSGRSVYCVIKDKYGNKVKTNTVILKIKEYVTITKQPVKDFAASGEIVSATVRATGDGLKYQWYLKNPGSATYKKTTNTTPTYKVKISASNSGRKVYCVVSDRYGNQVKTKAVSLAMLSITKQPTNQTGTEVSTTVKAQGDGLSYRWYFKDVEDTSFKAGSVTSATYSIKMSSARNGRQIYCKITDKYGNSVKTKVCTLKMLAITQQPESNSGQKVSTTVKAIGEGLSYQWYFKDTDMSGFQKSSVTSATYTVNMTENNTGRQVYCVVTDKHGNSVKSKTATLYILKITKQPYNSFAGEWKTAQTEIEAIGEGLSYQWYTTDDLSSDTYTLEEAFQSTYMRAYFSGSFTNLKGYCVVTDKFGNSVTSDVAVLTRFEITAQTKNMNVGYNQGITIYVTAHGEGLTYQWYVADRDFPEYSAFPQTNSAFTINSNYIAGYSRYYCVITDAFGNQIQSDPIVITFNPYA